MVEAKTVVEDRGEVSDVGEGLSRQVLIGDN